MLLLPTIYYPKGKPLSADENQEVLAKIKLIFDARRYYFCRLKHFAQISKVIGLPLYAKKAVYSAVCRCSKLSPDAFPAITFDNFVTYWNKMIKENHDQASRFIFTLSVARTGLPRSYLEREDFLLILEDITQTHLEFSFLEFCGDVSVVFREKYMEMVLTKIFWDCSRTWWTGRFVAEQLRKSKFLEAVNLLEECGKKLPPLFSYEEFYVVYSKFWELDEDHDMKLSREDLKNYGKGTLSDLIVERIFSDVVRPKKASPLLQGTPVKQPNKEETIGFEEFTAFLLAEEDKRHPTAIEYWFRCLDLDGDGIISPYEMELFYYDMVDKILKAEFDALEFSEIASQLYDIVSPQDGKNFTLRDIKRCGLAPRFLNSLVSCAKYLHRVYTEREEPKVKPNGEKGPSDWEQFTKVEYQMLSLKELEEEMKES